jgi:pimeloyl-ACP methyl ester carboxylesterase
VAPTLAARGLSVVAVDLPGLGESAPPSDGDYHKATTADRLHEVMRGLGHDRYKVVGHDIGGMVAYALAARHPQAVEKLVLSEFWLPGFGLEEGMDVAQGGSFHFGFHMKADLATELTKGKVDYYLRKQAFTGMSRADQDMFVRSYERPGRMRAGFEHYATLLDDGRQFRSLAAQGKLAMPVLVMGGQQSFPVEKLTSGVRSVASDYRVVVVPRAHHWLWLEEPKVSADHLVSFLTP